MFGFYLHIPFCARRCPYCDFAIHIGARESFVAEYVAALRREIEIASQNQKGNSRELTSIFFGGGTPTFLDAGVLASLLQLIRDNFRLASDVEITIEANPENLDWEKLEILQKAGFNRISLGVQSLDDDALKFLGRVHRASDVEAAVLRAREIGWENISLDLIYAVPNQPLESWKKTLERSTRLPIQHVSCYSLTIEDDTSFGRRAAKGVLIPVIDDAQADQMQMAQEVLEIADFSRYEISNYARPNFESKHNRNYWNGGDYLAVGCGAHGHENGTRWWNERDAEKYVALMESQNDARAGQEVLTSRQRLDELVMLGLRTREGFSISEVSRKLNFDARSTLDGALPELLAQNWLEESGDTIRLMPHAFPVADAIAAKLLA